MESKKVTMEIELKRVCLSIVRRFWLILLVGLLLCALAFGYASFFMDDIYAAEVRMYVNNTYGADTMGFSSSQMMAAQSLASTYMVVLDTYDVLEDVAQVAYDDYGASKTYKVSELRSMVRTESIDETEVFRIVVSCTDKSDAVAIANAINDVLPSEVSRVTGAAAAEKDEDGNNIGAEPLVSLQSAEYKGKVAPNEKNYAIVGFLIGAVVTAIAVVVRDLMDTSINSEAFLTDAYEDIPLLAVIPDAENPKAGSGYKGYYESQKKKPAVQQKPSVQQKPPVQQKGGNAQ